MIHSIILDLKNNNYALTEKGESWGIAFNIDETVSVEDIFEGGSIKILALACNTPTQFRLNYENDEFVLRLNNGKPIAISFEDIFICIACWEEHDLAMVDYNGEFIF